MADDHERTSEIYLPPGLLYADAVPCVIRTIVDSGVAVCLWSSRLRVGGMTHYLLPRGARSDEASMRFGEIALDLLLARLHTLGSSVGELHTHIYGGATVLPATRQTTTLGADNVEVARRFSRAHGLPVVEEDVLGHTHRRVDFDVGSGQAQVTCLASA